MATIAHFPAFPSLIFTPHRHLNISRRTLHYQRLPIRFAVRAASSSSSVKKSRRKVKSNEELCNELKEFIAAVGLPQGHVPSMKELSLNGRNDLAYIVRRRGYKLVRELLADSTETDSSDIDGNAGSCTAGNHDATEDGRKNIISGQDQAVYEVVEELTSSSKDSVLESDYGSLVSAPVPEHEESVHMQVEFLSDKVPQEKFSYGSEGECEKLDIGNNVHVSTVPAHSNSYTSVTSLSLPITVLEENDPGVSLESGTNWTSNQNALNGSQDGMVENLVEEFSSSTDISALLKEDNSSSESELTHNSDEESYALVRYPAKRSLEERVTHFMQNGDLGLLEDNIYGLLNESDDHKIEGADTLGGNAEEVEQSTSSEHSKDVLGGSEETSNNDFSSIIRDDSSSAEGKISLPDLDVKTSEREDQYDSSRLKFMLHQKELELSQLKEQIEKEQHTLSVLQANAETAIAEAQKLIREKDAELLAAEESLSGLVEVEVQYCGDGEIVEVTGSFNGWHHQVNLDPEPSSSTINHVGSRLWSTRLWLYPGVYEIKFIVDGDWKIDPQRETVIRGTITNNILRVDA